MTDIDPAGGLCYTRIASSRGMRGAFPSAQYRRPRTTATASTEAALGSGLSLLERTMEDEGREEWRPIPGKVGYDVSNRGRVRSHRHRRSKTTTPKILKPWSSRATAYPCVSLQGGARRHFCIHRLMLLAFRGAPASGQVARHLDGSRTNNRLENLVWGTHKENAADTLRHGRRLQGETMPTHKLTAEQALLAVTDYLDVPTRTLARRFGVTPGAIRFIRKGETWSSVTKWEERG